jgi:S-adenosylmethionine hydrolase
MNDFNAWEITNSKYMLKTQSSTFHGRDIFSPVAAHLSLGISCKEFGPSLTKLTSLKMPMLWRDDNSLNGEILYPDHFGNLLTSLGKFVTSSDTSDWRFIPWLPGLENEQISLPLDAIHLVLDNGQTLQVVKTFKDIPIGECAGLVGSSGLMEIAAYRSNPAKILNLQAGTKVKLIFS